ncbi:hypothetical protein [Candidatus Rhabdochlamydia oedothoracis]|uniref:hypothetical protein n=1 Tax=Candidatus Rhabdochlamydia oedothoracis TaxID=2720720 RepID=UPI001C64C98C|nr:hypothetical protein [Candidatus Rhabdochlamydia oedothoracis]
MQLRHDALIANAVFLCYLPLSVNLSLVYYTLTADNGKEFAYHQMVSFALSRRCVLSALSSF